MNAPDVRLHEDQTEEFINAEPAWIVFVRQATEPDQAGGVRKIGSPVHLQPQLVRVIGLRTPTVRVTADGKEVIVDKAVVGMPDVNIAYDDSFDFNGKTYHVVTIMDRPPWRIRAEVTSRG